MENQNQLTITFELSDNNNPITDNYGNVIGSISDVVDAVYNAVPDLADLVSLVFNQQRKQIEDLQEELQALEEDAEKEKESLEDNLSYVVSKATRLTEFEITELQNEIAFQAENEQTITVDTAKMINEKLEDIAYALRNIENYY